jgi:hypothetical protein
MKKIVLLIIFILVFVAVKAQETVPVSGGQATAAGSLNQGIQKSIEFITLSNPELTALTLNAVTYPNPTSESIILALKASKLTGLSYVMYDLLGRFVSKGRVTKTETKIAMESLPLGVYILRVQQNNQELKTFKIIKH